MEAQLAQMRVDYRRDELDVGDLAGTWHEQLARWLADATAAGVVEPNAMVLATAGDDGTPSSRTVLCKDVDERGVVFYTNYTSAKSHDLRVDPARRGDLPLVRRSTGRCTCAARSSGSPRRRPTPTGRPARAARSWARGRRRSRPTCATATRSTPRWRPPSAVRRRRRGAGAAALGRLADRPGQRRVLAGPGQPDARPAAVRAERRSTGRGRCAGSRPDHGASTKARRRARPGGSPERVTTRDDDPTRPMPKGSDAPTAAVLRGRGRAARSPTPARCARPPTGGCGRPGSSRSSARSSRSSRCRRRSTSSPARRPTSA